MNTDINNTQEQVYKMIDSIPQLWREVQLYLLMHPCRLSYLDKDKIPNNIIIQSITICPIDKMYISESSFVSTDSQ
jgi:hypothetical protein